MTKAQDERRIFALLASCAGLAVVPDSIRQNNPPAPDIECRIQGFGPLAIELLALDAPDTRKRLQNMDATSDAWKHAFETWPTTVQEKLREECNDVFMVLSISNDAGARDRKELMTSIQEQLFKKPTGFTGNLCQGVKVIRGDDITNGPQINAPSAGSWLMPQISKIEEKLTSKIYCTSAPLELFAYSTHDEVDAHVDSLSMIDECVRKHLQGSKFQRVRVFDAMFRQMKYSYPQ
ncbi:hypothetical protein [Collimonas humicola]|uniref:hypothetical protein n=1 Tax=Collimonas humicola TaxID=2825886 RepID=UPI001B8BE7DD|nr:hypothetical protein [Collimonas humicola]